MTRGSETPGGKGQAFLQKQDEARANSRQGLRRREKRVEKGWTHRRIRLAVGRISRLRYPRSRQ